MSEKKKSKRQQRREMRQKQEMRSRIITISVIVIGALLVAFALIYPNLRPAGEFVTPDEHLRPMANGNAMGDPDAPIRIEEFSDFQCPYCQRWYIETEGQLIDTYIETGKVYFIYRSFGAFLGPESAATAEAAYCAGDQNKYWQMHDIIFENHPGGENINYYTDRQIAAFAEALDLDMDAFLDCYNSGKYRDQLQKDLVDGQAAGVTGTPAFVITYTVDGQQKQRLIAGAYPFSEFQKQIDEALAEMGLE
ncbi:MAG: hypothetical protein Kow002_20010 [Anaerolineales bacterium]